MKVAENAYVEVHAVSEHDFRYLNGVLVHRRVLADPRAEFAMELMKAHGNLSINEACTYAAAAFQEFKTRRWLLDVPPFEALTPNKAQD